MLTYPSLENLHALRLTGMASALEEQLQMPEVNTLSFEERLGLMLHLASCEWVKRHYNALITGPTGVGKSYIACALAHKACLEGHTASTGACRACWKS